MKKKDQPGVVPICRRVFVEIIGTDRIRISNPYRSKEFTAKKGEGYRRVDAVSLKQIQSYTGLYVEFILEKSGNLRVDVLCGDEIDGASHLKPVLSTARGCPRVASYTATVIEDEKPKVTYN